MVLGSLISYHKQRNKLILRERGCLFSISIEIMKAELLFLFKTVAQSVAFCARYVANGIRYRGFACKKPKPKVPFFRFLFKKFSKTESKVDDCETECKLELLTRRQFPFSFLRGSFKSTMPMEGRDTK